MLDKSQSSNLRVVSFSIPADLVHQIRVEAARLDLSRSAYVTKLLQARDFADIRTQDSTKNAQGGEL